jgi:hypothetical protein
MVYLSRAFGGKRAPGSDLVGPAPFSSVSISPTVLEQAENPSDSGISCKITPEIIVSNHSDPQNDAQIGAEPRENGNFIFAFLGGMSLICLRK